MKLHRIAFAVASAFVAASAFATPSYVNGIAIPGTALDVSGGTSVNDGRLGFFSDLYYDNLSGEWYGLSDRGPGGGTMSYDTRVQRFTVNVNSTTGAISNFQVAQTIKFTDATGANTYNGLAPSPTNVLGRAFDPEGFVVNPVTRNYLVSDEYGPRVVEFDRNGRFVREFDTPAGLIPRNGTTNTRNFADDTGNTAGKRTNRGFEGLAISPDGRYAYAMLQSAMLDEGGGSGVYNRIVKFDTTTGDAVAQYAYKMEGSSQGRGISALVALGNDKFLVLERNNRGVGVASELTTANKKVYQIDLAGATDINGKTILTNTGGTGTATITGGASLVPVAKSLFKDLMSGDNPFSATGGQAPEKLEGMTIGPQLANGQYMMLFGTDNDYSVTQNAALGGNQREQFFNPATGARIECDLGGLFIGCLVVNANGSTGTTPFTGTTAGFDLIPGLLYSYATQGNDLLGYVAPVPLPAPLALFAAGLGAFGWSVRRRKAA